MIVGGVLAGVVLVVALLAGAIVGVVFYAIANSEAAETAKEFLRQNDTLKADIGEVRDFGYFVTGSLHANSPGCDATLRLKAIGARRDAETTVNLLYRNNREWRVCGASYRNEAGALVSLLDIYGAPDDTTETEAAGASEEIDGVTDAGDDAMMNDAPDDTPEDAAGKTESGAGKKNRLEDE